MIVLKVLNEGVHFLLLGFLSQRLLVDHYENRWAFGWIIVAHVTGLGKSLLLQI